MNGVPETLYRQARQRLAQTSEPQAIIEIDSGPSMVMRVVPLSYCDNVEFEAFDGRILEVLE